MAAITTFGIICKGADCGSQNAYDSEKPSFWAIRKCLHKAALVVV